MKRVSLVVLCLVVVAAGLYHVPVNEVIRSLVINIRTLGHLAAVAFFVIFIVAAILGFSRSVLAVLAGVLFEPVTAFVVVMSASIVAFMCTFFIARYFAGDWVRQRLAGIPVAQALMSAVEHNGFRMLVLMRLNPFVPGFVNGYGFGLTPIQPMVYLLASIVGSLPLIVIYIYIGWLGELTLLHTHQQPELVGTYSLYFGMALSLLTFAIVIWHGHRYMKSLPGQQGQSTHD